MPQMAPMSWALLFMFFTLMLIIMSSMNYYNWICPSCRVEKSGIDKNTPSMNWKW